MFVRLVVDSTAVAAYSGKCYLKILCVVFDVATRTRQEESRNESCELEEGGETTRTTSTAWLTTETGQAAVTARATETATNGVLYAFLTWFNECREKHQQEKWNNCHWRHEKGNTGRGIWRLPVAVLLFLPVANGNVREVEDKGELGFFSLELGTCWCGEAALLN